MTNKVVVHVQLNGGYLPHDSQVFEDIEDAKEYIISYHDGDIKDFQPDSAGGIWTLEYNTHATIETLDYTEHADLIADLIEGLT